MIGGYPVHPLADAFPLFTGERFEELCRSIAAVGLNRPIVMHNGVLIDGRNRLRACLAVGVEPSFVEYSQPRPVGDFIWEENAIRRDLEPDQRAMAATAFLDYEQKQRQEAKAEAAAKAREHRWAEPEEYDEPSEDNDGEHLFEPISVQTEEPAKPNATARAIAERANVSRYKAEQAIAVKRYDDERGTDIGEQVAKGELKLKDAAKHVRGTFGTGQNEWYTPAEYVEKARAVMGAIDLDPASTEAANQVIQAERIFTHEDDGLAQQWSGRVWLNPPYARKNVARFAEKTLAEIDAGRVQSCIVLVNNYTDTAWFHRLAGRADALCLTRGRIRFVSPRGAADSPIQGNVFVYFGPDAARFSGVFSDVGLCLRPY